MKKILFFICLLWSIASSAQIGNQIWYFGQGAGIDFSSSTPTPLSNGVLNSLDCSSALTDDNGQLIMYTNGQMVYNKNHALMLNGSGLNGSNNGGQAALIVPQPFSNLCYIFSVDQFAGSQGFNYHIVDLTLDNGNGEVISKNNLLFSPSTERIDAIYNSQDSSFWIITHSWNTNDYLCYKLTPAGLNIIPVVSSIGSIHQGGLTGVYNSMGQLTFSKDGSKVACGIYSLGQVEIFDFDMQTGLLSNPIAINNIPNTWGVAFSKEATKLYLTSWFSKNIYQVDLSSGNQFIMQSTLTNIGTVDGPGFSGYYSGYLQLAPNDIIYIASFGDTYLGQITYPEDLGVACGLVDNGFYLGGSTCNAGLCRTVNMPEKVLLSINTIDHKSPFIISTISNGQFEIEIRNNDKYSSCKLFDISGRLLKTVYSENNIFKLECEVSGVYMIIANSENGRQLADKIFFGNE
ncbi:MAG TPA: hypothetical protein PKH65_08615 [Bacteroidia bacterium]|nr:hypothetical protein [Bacteroidia bacterium]HNT80728.1 hypothetical protein [Bacteroidia bacterium]